MYKKTVVICKFDVGQTVRVVETGLDPSVVSLKNPLSRVGQVNSIAGYGEESPDTRRYHIGVVFEGDRDNAPPTIFNEEELELLRPKFI